MDPIIMNILIRKCLVPMFTPPLPFKRQRVIGLGSRDLGIPLNHAYAMQTILTSSQAQNEFQLDLWTVMLAPPQLP